MNKVILMGRLTRDPELRYGSGANATAICRYTLAVDRSYKREGEPTADFINIVAFGARGEFASKYFKKGRMVAVVGELRLGSYDDKDGNKRYTTDVVVSEQFFADSANSGNNDNASRSSDFAPAGNGYNRAPAQAAPSDSFVPVNEIEGDEDLPF